MLIPSSIASRRPSLPNRPLRAIAAALLGLGLVGAPSAAPAQQVVFDPRNHLENALQAARQLESLANEARSLAASPYSHLSENSRSLRDMAELARTARGAVSTVSGLEQQFRSLYPEDVSGADLLELIEQGQARTVHARRTAEDVARAAAELERLGQGRDRRLSGALAASQSATGQTAAIQSTNQLLAVLAEDLAALRTITLAQSRLVADAAAREAAQEASGQAARRQRWNGPATAMAPSAPRFDPFSHAAD